MNYHWNPFYWINLLNQRSNFAIDTNLDEDLVMALLCESTSTPDLSDRLATDWEKDCSSYKIVKIFQLGKNGFPTLNSLSFCQKITWFRYCRAGFGGGPGWIVRRLGALLLVSHFQWWIFGLQFPAWNQLRQNCRQHNRKSHYRLSMYSNFHNHLLQFDSWCPSNLQI